jgi:hypothetical protein
VPFVAGVSLIVKTPKDIVRFKQRRDIGTGCAYDPATAQQGQIKTGGTKNMAKKLKKSKKLEATKPLTIVAGRAPARG